MSRPPEVANLFELISKCAGARPPHSAIRARGRPPLEHGRLPSLLRETAASLAELGCRANDRVAIVLERSPETATACLAVSACATCVPLNPEYTAGELQDLMDRLGVSLLLTSPEQRSAREAATALDLPVVDVRPMPAAEAGVFGLDTDGARGCLGPPTRACALLGGLAEETALVLHTSGSTALPKIVPLTHRNLIASARNVAASLELGPDDVCLSALPLFHVGGIVDLLLAPLSAGGSVVVAAGSGAGDFFAHLDEDRPTWYQGVPTMLSDILHRAESEDLEPAGGSLRFVRAVSAPLPPPTLQAFEDRFGVPVVEMYGMTETAGVITSNPLPPGVRKPGSVGIAAGPELAVVDAAGNEAPPGVIGEVRVRGPSVMRGYETEGPSGNAGLVDGWLLTGDLGHVDAEGYLTLTGRIKEIINRGGEKIAPREIDEIALAHADVSEAAAFAVPHPTLGEEVALAVVPVPGHSVDPADIRAHCEDRLARFKVPRAVHVCDGLPRAPGGKLQRSRLPEWCAGHRARPGAPSGAPTNERQAVLIDIWKDVLSVPSVGVHDDFFDLGGDSLRAVELVLRVGAALDGEVPAATLYDNPTVASLDAALDAPAPSRTPEPPRGPGEEMLAEVRELISTWEGRRPTPASLLVGWNTVGSLPPLFWGVQGYPHLRHFAEQVGPERPIYGMRSLHETTTKSPENMRVLAHRYAEEIQAIRPDGPLHLGGYCAGGALAFRIARELRAAGRYIASLSLMEHFEPEPYDGRVAFFFGVESGWHPFRTADPTWLGPYGGRVSMHPSRYGHEDVPHDPIVLEALRRELVDAHRVAEQSPSAVPAVRGPQARSERRWRVQAAGRLPRLLSSRERRGVHLHLVNRGATAWPPGTTLFTRWRRPGSSRAFFDGATRLDREVPPGAEATVAIDVRAPLAPGPWRLSFDLVHGGDWNEHVESGLRSSVLVLPGTAVWPYLREELLDRPAALLRRIRTPA